jgi:hypothetical protein
MKDRISSVEEQSEPYYRAVGARGLQLAAAAPCATRELACGVLLLGRQGGR